MYQMLLRCHGYSAQASLQNKAQQSSQGQLLVHVLCLPDISSPTLQHILLPFAVSSSALLCISHQLDKCQFFLLISIFTAPFSYSIHLSITQSYPLKFLPSIAFLPLPMISSLCPISKMFISNVSPFTSLYQHFTN